MFNVKKVEEAKRLLESFPNNRKIVDVKVEDAYGLVLAEDVYSNFDIPHFSRSTVDGYAVMHKDCSLASSTVPVLLHMAGSVEMGESFDLEVKENAIYVPTGGYLPKGADSVVMIENTEMLGDEVIIYQAPSIYENVLKMSSDVALNDLLLTKGTKLNERTIGLLAGAGVVDVPVFKPLTAVVISTGDEIVAPHKTPKIGEIRDINTYTIKNYLEKLGVQVLKTLIINDEFQKYFNEVDNAIKAVDMVITSGGSSVGDKDYTIDVLKELNAEVLTHGINIKPGKPTIIGNVDGKLFFGLPGQPLSAYTVLNALFEHYLLSQNESFRRKHKVMLPLLKSVHAAPGRVTYQLVKISEYAEPIYTKSGMIKGLSDADGYIVLKENSEGLEKGEQVEVILFD